LYNWTRYKFSDEELVASTAIQNGNPTKISDRGGQFQCPIVEDPAERNLIKEKV